MNVTRSLWAGPGMNRECLLLNARTTTLSKSFLGGFVTSVFRTITRAIHAFHGTHANLLGKSGERRPSCKVLVYFVFEGREAGGHRSLNEEDVFVDAGRSVDPWWPKHRVLLPHLQQYMLQCRFCEKSGRETSAFGYQAAQEVRHCYRAS